MRKGSFRFLLFFITCLAVLVFARDAVVALLADLALHRFYPRKEGCSYTYARASWEGRVLSVSDIEVHMPNGHLHVEKIELVLGLKPHLFLIHPHWTKVADGGEIKSTPKAGRGGGLALFGIALFALRYCRWHLCSFFFRGGRSKS